MQSNETTSIAYNMDCVEGMKMLQDEYIDLTVTSPPYDGLRTYNGYSFDWKKTLQQLYRITKIGGVVVWIVNDQTINGSETGTSFRQALYGMECGFNLHDTMIWRKNGFTDVASLKYRYAQVFEYMFVFSKGLPKTFNPIKDRRNINGGKTLHGTIRQKDGSTKQGSSNGKTIGEYGIRYNVWNIESEHNNETNHPAVFPRRLVEDHIKTWTNEGDLVCDCFLGSGTTRICCHDLNRNFIGYEISREYFEEQERRYIAYTSQMKLL